MGTPSNTKRSRKSAYIVSVLPLYFTMQHQQYEYHNKKAYSFWQKHLMGRNIFVLNSPCKVHHRRHKTKRSSLKLIKGIRKLYYLLKLVASCLLPVASWSLTFILCFPTPAHIVLPTKCITHHESGQLPNYITVKFNQHEVPSGSEVCNLLCSAVRANCRWCRSASIVYEQVVIDASVTMFQLKG